MEYVSHINFDSKAVYTLKQEKFDKYLTRESYSNADYDQIGNVY